ncbi:baseplate J/gp47 family protein [Piscinibacter sakaiensis]|uniref:baseplate J/gp47 family protein n=1 Tax=Piscinibacter sakaiensis TaxID=1547922 RepID=UPI003AB082BA
MPLPVPQLDDRRFDDLVAELLARIPSHTPEWTNPRVGDPGRTLVELFAFLGDTLLYRANQVPERQRRVFLNLLGLGLKPARPARGLVALRLPDEGRDAVDLRARARIERPVPFETLQEVSIAPVTGEAYIKRRVSAETNPELTETIAQLGQLYGGRSLDTYETTPLFANGLAVPQGIDVVADTVDRCVWMALLAPKPARGEDPVALRDRAREQLARDASGAPRLLNVGVLPALVVPDEQRAVGAREQIDAQWEISVGGARATDYHTLDVASGSSDGLRRAGVFRLVPPGADLIGVGDSVRGIDALSGVDDEPPRLDDPERAQRLVAWLRLRAAPSTMQLRLAWIGLHAVQVEQGTRSESLVVAQTRGIADERIVLPLRNIDPASLQLAVAEPGADYDAWTRVDDLALLSHRPDVARNARAYELDPQSGEVRLGDGVRGRVPAAGSRVKIVSARAGGGRAGNLAPLTLKEITGWRVADRSPVSNLKVLQPSTTVGGEDAETVEAAEARIPGVLRHRERAVTADDYRVLALQTPGVDIARVEVLPRFVPRSRAFGVPGVVTVLALPGTIGGGVGTAPNPRADQPLIEAVFAQLDSRRPLATELYVIGCEYVPIAVSVGVSLRDDAQRDATLAAVRAALRRLLWPLAPGGFDGVGWALGRSVADRELEVEAARVAGIASVAGVNLFVREGNGWALVGRNGNGAQQLALAGWQLPELMQVVVAVGNAAPERIDADIGGGGEAGTRVAVPVITDLC